MNRLPSIVTLNLFQGPSCPIAQAASDQTWMLKQVRHDEWGQEQ
ncbi:MAG: hypothetical protein V7676_05330 [Parasphingorhabdus sp.]